MQPPTRTDVRAGGPDVRACRYFEGLLFLIWELLPQKVVLPLLQKGSDAYGWFPAVDKVGRGTFQRTGCQVPLVSRRPQRDIVQVAWVYTVLISLVFGGLAGLTQRVLGSPGDLPETIHCIHEKGYIPAKSAPSMFICSAFSITAGMVSQPSTHKGVHCVKPC